jgi:hypothetical protein
MSDIDFDRLQPLRVAVGSHQEGSGRGCAMNVVSYVTGDTKITDYPECSHSYLSNIVQKVNDTLGRRRGRSEISEQGDATYLTPEDALTVIELGLLTVDTAGKEDLFGPGQFTHAQKLAAAWTRLRTNSQSVPDEVLDMYIRETRQLLLDIREHLGLAEAPKADRVAEKLVTA